MRLAQSELRLMAYFYVGSKRIRMREDGGDTPSVDKHDDITTAKPASSNVGEQSGHGLPAKHRVQEDALGPRHFFYGFDASRGRYAKPIAAEVQSVFDGVWIDTHGEIQHAQRVRRDTHHRSNRIRGGGVCINPNNLERSWHHRLRDDHSRLAFAAGAQVEVRRGKPVLLELLVCLDGPFETRQCRTDAKETSVVHDIRGESRSPLVLSNATKRLVHIGVRIGQEGDVRTKNAVDEQVALPSRFAIWFEEEVGSKPQAVRRRRKLARRVRLRLESGDDDVRPEPERFSETELQQAALVAAQSQATQILALHEDSGTIETAAESTTVGERSRELAETHPRYPRNP